MRIEITNEQYKLIQDELIILENELADRRDKINGWDYDWYLGRIGILKRILEKEYIDLSEIIN